MMAGESDEARRSVRHRVDVVVPVVDMISHRALGVTRDLSAGGMRLLIVKPLVDDALYQVGFELDGPAGRRLPIEAGVQVVGQRREAQGVLAGMRFIHLDPDNAWRLNAWLASREVASR